MAQVNQAMIKFAPSASADVTGYKMYLEADPGTVNYNSQSFALGNPAPVDGMINVDIAALPGMTTYDGVYNIGVVAVDDAGNESSMSVKTGVALDFVAPDPPGEITVVRS
jgi:hypothetical protein